MQYFPASEVEALVVTLEPSLFINWNKCLQAKINRVHKVGVTLMLFGHLEWEVLFPVGQ